MSENELEFLGTSANEELSKIEGILKNDAPDVFNSISSKFGESGGELSLSNLSKIGVASTIGAASTVVGGIIAGPVFLLGVGGYAIAKKIFNRRKDNAKKVAALNQAIKKLHDIQSRLQSNAEYYRDELAGLKVLTDMLISERKGKK